MSNNPACFSLAGRDDDCMLDCGEKHIVFQNDHNALLHWFTIFQSALPILLSQSQYRDEIKIISMCVSQVDACRLRGMTMVTGSGMFAYMFTLYIHDSCNFWSDCYSSLPVPACLTFAHSKGRLCINPVHL